MYDSDDSQLKQRVFELEKQLVHKNEQIDFLKSELSEVNMRLGRLVENSQHELKILKKIQECLVPTEYPNISGFEFSTKFVPSAVKGGDYFDVFDVSSRMKFGLVMTCSSGYGMSALLMSVLMRFSGFQLAAKDESVESIVKQITKELDGQLQEADQASVFFALASRKTYQMEYCILGDLKVFHYDYSSGELSLVDKTGEQLCGSENGGISKVKTQELTLNPRDRLVICSEGVFETKNLKDETLEPEALQKMIKPFMRGPIHELRNEVLYQAEKFSSGTEVQRDRTVIALEVKDRVIKLAKR